MYLRVQTQHMILGLSSDWLHPFEGDVYSLWGAAMHKPDGRHCFTAQSFCRGGVGGEGGAGFEGGSAMCVTMSSRRKGEIYR